MGSLRRAENRQVCPHPTSPALRSMAQSSRPSRWTSGSEPLNPLRKPSLRHYRLDLATATDFLGFGPQRENNFACRAPVITWHRLYVDCLLPGTVRACGGGRLRGHRWLRTPGEACRFDRRKRRTMSFCRDCLCRMAMDVVAGRAQFARRCYVALEMEVY